LGSPKVKWTEIVNFQKKCSIIGNAGSGKSTLAQRIQNLTRSPILDLDNITWDRARLQKRRPIEDSEIDLDKFITVNSSSWIVEGCYGELVERTLSRSPQLIFLDPGEATCLKNCHGRPWEKHKYPSKEDQDKFLQFLLSWSSEYYRRDGPMSHQFHKNIFETYPGDKILITSF